MLNSTITFKRIDKLQNYKRKRNTIEIEKREDTESKPAPEKKPKLDST